MTIGGSKTLRFLSRLSFTQTIHCIVVQTGLPVYCSRNFGPRVGLDFTSTLNINISTSIRCLSVRLTRGLPIPSIVRQVGTVSPGNFTILSNGCISTGTPGLVTVTGCTICALHNPLARSLDRSKLGRVLTGFGSTPDIFCRGMSRGNGRHIQAVSIGRRIIRTIRNGIGRNGICLAINVCRANRKTVGPSRI